MGQTDVISSLDFNVQGNHIKKTREMDENLWDYRRFPTERNHSYNENDSQVCTATKVYSVFQELCF